VCPPPTGLEVIPLLVSFDAIPASMVQPIVRADRFDDVRRFTVASFATVNLAMLAGCHGLWLILSFILTSPPSHKIQQVAICSMFPALSA
jgi:hypothetical protein